MARDFKLFYASDVHGAEKCFMKWVNAARFYGARVLVLGGDLTGKVMVPLVAAGGGRWRASYLGEQVEAAGEPELTELEKRIRFNGFYSCRCEPAEYRRLEEDAAYRQQVFDGLMRESVQRWVAIAEERLRGTGVQCYIMPGNDDDLFIDALLAASDVVVNPDGRLVEFEGWQMASFSTVNPTPWQSPRELPEAELEQRLRALVAQRDPQKPLICNFHVPPFGSTLDHAPLLKEDLSVVLEGGEPKLTPVGSRAVRKVIEEVRPALSVHGHVHESRGAVRIGPTLCINPGSEYGTGRLRGALITLGKRGVIGHQLLAG